MRRLLYTLALLLASATGTAAQVVVAPTVVIMSERARFGTYVVVNQSDRTQEVTVDFRFGYPATDSLGEIQMVYDDTAMSARRGIQEWVRPFPRRFVLQPGGQQVVRVAARPPADLDDGVYWTRIVTTSAPQVAPPQQTEEGITTQIAFRFEQVTTALFRHGSVATALELEDLSVEGDADEVTAWLTLTPGGNAPFMGSVRIRLTPPDGGTPVDWGQTLSIYTPQRLRIRIPRSELGANGRYSGEVLITAERGDLARADLLPIEPIVRRFEIDVP